jgi:Uma2 family endonuclease
MIVDPEPSSSVCVGARPAYLLGAPISLADLLALPPDGNRYARDEKGRLVFMAPDDAIRHRGPLNYAAGRLRLALDPAKVDVLSEAPIVFERTYALDGSILPPSHHGPKALVPDIACFARPPRFIRAPSGHTWYSAERLLLVVEFLSPSTWASDLGDAQGPSRDDVDRWRTYLENHVAEYWILNAGFERCGLPPRSGLFLSYDPDRVGWCELDVAHAQHASTDYRGRTPVVSGTVRSRSMAGLGFDLDQLWRDVEI